MSDIVIAGLSTSDPLPGVYLDLQFAQGNAAGSSSLREILILANKISTGTAVESTMIYGPDSDDPLQTEDNAKTLFGEGSEAHVMWKAANSANKDTVIRVLAVPEGGGAVKATGTITYTTNATGAGYTRVWVADEYVDVPFLSGDTVTTIAAAVVSAINAKPHWQVTATNLVGVVTITARNGGVRGNFIRYMARIFGTNGVSPGTTVTPITDSACTGGSVADDATAALATLATGKFYYIVSALGASAQITSLMAVVNAQAVPSIGIRQRAFFGSTDTSGNAITLGTTANATRAEIIHQQEGPIGPSRLAALAAACYAYEELTLSKRTNYAGYGNDEDSSKRWVCPPARTVSVRPTKTVQKLLLNGGITPVAANGNSSTYIVNRVTTRTLNGAIPDYRISRAHKVSICDFFSDDLTVKGALQGAAKRIGDDLLPGERAVGHENLFTPSDGKALVFSLIDDYADNTLVPNRAAVKEQTRVQRNSVDRTRMDFYIPLQTADNLEKLGFAVAQVA